MGGRGWDSTTFPRIIPESLITLGACGFTVRRKKEEAENNIGTRAKAFRWKKEQAVYGYIVRLI